MIHLIFLGGQWMIYEKYIDDIISIILNNRDQISYGETIFNLDDNKSVLYGKFKNAVRTLVSIGYDPEKDSKLVK